jgi:geranylgeranyl reductase family protein
LFVPLRDVIVVGAGPSGSYSSFLLSRRGFDVANLEEHMEVGRPVECTGLVSRRVMNMAKTKSAVNTVHGAQVFFPDGESVHVRKNEETIVMDRDQFDKDVSAMAISAGTDLRINSRVISVKIHPDHVQVRYRQDGNLREEKARAIIGADGINSRVRKDVFGSVPRRIVSCYQVDSAVRLEDQDSVQVFVGSKVSRGFFAWATPSGDMTKIGLGNVGGGAKSYFDGFNRRFPANRILGINGGAIPIAYLRKTYSDRTLLVGDAAGIVKPLSGGGIYTGMVSGSHAAATLERALESDDLSWKSLSAYQKGWRSDLGRELWIDGLVQRFFAMLGDRSFNSMYRFISRPEIIGLINRTGDIDFPSRVVLSLMARNPWMFLSAFRHGR